MLIIVNRLKKQFILILCYKTITVKDLTKLFIANVYRYYESPKIIVLNWNSQFISNFWNKIYYILGIKLKLLLANYLQTNE